MTTESINSKVALVTGASSGIGRALCVTLAGAGYSIAALARRKERLDELKKEIESSTNQRVETVLCDIKDAKAMDEAISGLIKKFGRLDLVVANAGFTIAGALEALTAEDYLNIFNTNFGGMLNTIYPSLEALKSSAGMIIIMGSILGEFGIMERSAYVSTKFAMRGFYESVRYELREKGVTTMLIEPGFVKTELRFFDKQGNRLRTVTQDKLKKTSHGISVPPEEVAGDVVKLLNKRGFHHAVITGHAKWMHFFNRFFPGLMSSEIYKHRDWVRRKVVK